MKSVPSKAQQGFTLIELTTALLSSGVAMVMGGVGLVSVLSYSQETGIEIDTQQDGVHALDFITAEARQAVTFKDSPDPSSPFLSVPGATTPVVVIERDFDADGTIDSSRETIVYFLADAIAPWQGKALYRWGPPFDADGEYDMTIPATAWNPALLVDQISEVAPSTNCNGWQKVPSTNEGFNACLGARGKIAEFVLHSNVVGKELRSKAFARSISF